MSSSTPDLPFLDEHRTLVDAPREVVWAALRRYVDTSLGFGAGNPLAVLLGTQPRAGFEVAHEYSGHELGMAGRHRFSRYALVFRLTESANGQTTMAARSYAEFPGLHGRVYRALVIGTGAHVVATNQILRAIRRSVPEPSAS